MQHHVMQQSTFSTTSL